MRVLSGLLKNLQLASNRAANGPQFLCSILFIKLSPIIKSLRKTPIFVLSRASLRRVLICARSLTRETLLPHLVLVSPATDCKRECQASVDGILSRQAQS